MTERKMLSQSEIDALLGGPITENVEETVSGNTGNVCVDLDSPKSEGLNDDEKDALGEIGNISMGTAATTLSELLRQKVNITSPKVYVITQEQLLNTFKVPYIIIQVEYKAGLNGMSILVIELKDAMVMADLMMGGDGLIKDVDISDIQISAASEAMNQMIGSSSTSLATIFGRPINISPPVTTVLESGKQFRLPIGEDIVIISFKMKIENLLDTTIMQILGIETAKNEASLLWHNLMGVPLPDEVERSIDPGGPAGSVTEDEIQDDAWLSKQLWPENVFADAAERIDSLPERPDGQKKPNNSILTEKAAIEISMKKTGPVSIEEPSRTTGRAQAVWQERTDSAMSFPGLSAIEQRKMDLLLDVPLKVSVILGRSKRPIKEILNMTPGAIVELNSLVDDPLEILVNGTLVARGEVVVVNENFGIKITSIISAEERLRQLAGK